MDNKLKVLLILCAASIVRLHGISFCLPFRYGHIDESVVIFYTMRFFGEDITSFPFFDYLILYLYLLLAVYFLINYLKIKRLL